MAGQKLSDDPVEAIVQMAILDADEKEASRGPFYPLFDLKDLQLKEGGSYPLSTYFDRLPPHFRKLLAPLASDPTVFFSPTLIATEERQFAQGEIPVIHVYSVAGTLFSDPPPLARGTLLLPPGRYPIGIAIDPRVEGRIFAFQEAPQGRESHGPTNSFDLFSDPLSQQVGAEFFLGGLPLGLGGNRAMGRSEQGTPSGQVEDFYRGAPSVDSSRWGWSYGHEIKIDDPSPPLAGETEFMAAGTVAVPGGRGVLQTLRKGGGALKRAAGRVWRSAPVRIAFRALTVDFAANVGSWAIKEIKWDKDAGSQLMLYVHNRMVDEDCILGPIGTWGVELTWGVSMAVSDDFGQVYSDNLRWKSESLVTENRWFTEGVEGFLKDTFEQMITDSRREHGRADLIEVATTDGEKTVVFDVDVNLSELERRLFHLYNGQVTEGVNPALIEARYEELDYTGFRLPHGKLLKEVVDEEGVVTDHAKFRLYLSALFQEELDKARGEQERQMVDGGLGEMREGVFHSLLPTIIAEAERGQRKLTEAQKDFLRREKKIGPDSLTWRIKFLEGITGKLNAEASGL